MSEVSDEALVSPGVPAETLGETCRLASSAVWRDLVFGSKLWWLCRRLVGIVADKRPSELDGLRSKRKT
jgi:hypothetical protein